ncbi:IS5 family transposase, partial [Frankia sp. AiPs1]|uniref:IS5 family transposase n=1 Tax=Frankia sp. AiPs1 TaxID=573493 RepID=UPI002043890C
MARSHRYPSDLSDQEWAYVQPLLPPAPKDGRPEKHDRRDIVDAILYVTHNGVVWRALPADFPPWKTVYGFFERWKRKGVVLVVHDGLRDQVRRAEGRSAEPTAGVIDSQSVKGAPTVTAPTRGYDAGKKVNGRRRFIVVDTLGMLLTVLVVPANRQDRDGARQLLVDHYFTIPTCRFLFADGGFAGRFVTWATTVVKTTVEIVRKKEGQQGFQPLPKRWVVERTLAWITAHRRLARDYERDPASSAAFVHWAMIHTMVRRLARRTPVSRWTPRTTS